MQSEALAAPASKGALWAGWIMTALPALFLLADGGAKLVKPQVVVDGTVQLGYSESVIVPLGIVLLISVAVHLIPQAAMLGAILLTGYLGGAVASHVRMGHPWATHILFPVYFGVLIWGGLYLRDQRVSAVVQTGTQTSGPPKMLWAGWILTALPGVLLMFSGVMKLIQPEGMPEEFMRLGYPVSLAAGIGIVELLCAALYMIPRTSVLGAILLTGYLGGATATHVRIGDAFIMPIIVGVVLWAGLYLRDPNLRALIRLRKSA